MTRHRVAIVGAGSAGCIMAARLSESPEMDVVLFEDGSFRGTDAAGLPTMTLRPTWLLDEAADRAMSRSWEVPTNGNRHLELIAGRTIGGSGRINAGYFMRPTAQDLAAWGDVIGRDDWPDRMLQAMIRSETDLDHPDSPIHGGTGPVMVSRDLTPLHPISAVFRESAFECGMVEHHDHNDGGPVGIGTVPLNSAGGFLADQAITYLMPAIGRDNLRVLDNHHVTRVLMDGSRAVGLEVVAGGRSEVISADDVILCAGTIGSASILHASGIGDATALRNSGIEPMIHSPRVGSHYWNHPFVDLSFMTDDRTLAAGGPEDTFMQLIAHADRGSGHASNAEYMATRRPYGVVTGNDPSDRMLAIRITLTDATAGGSITPTTTGPEVTDNHLGSVRDRQALGASVRFGLGMLGSAPFRTLVSARAPSLSGTATTEADIDDFVSERLAVSYHMIGSCPMGTDPLTSVVDPRFRVHDVEALRVVDASVLPIQISRGPAACVVGLGELAAEEFMGPSSPGSA